MGHQAAYQFTVAYVASDERIPWVTLEHRQVSKIASVRELVNIHQRLAVIAEPESNEITADKAGTTGH